MNIETFDNLEGVKLINLPIYLDNRGSFSAIPNPASYLEGDIVQINNSVSHKGVLRGTGWCHYGVRMVVLASGSQGSKRG